MDDTIFRADAIALANGGCHPANLAEELAKLPSAQPERNGGKWMYDKGLYKCSSCNELWTHWWAAVCPEERMYKWMKYCPNCGARMDGDENG